MTAVSLNGDFCTAHALQELLAYKIGHEGILPNYEFGKSAQGKQIEIKLSDKVLIIPPTHIDVFFQAGLKVNPPQERGAFTVESRYFNAMIARYRVA